MTLEKLQAEMIAAMKSKNKLNSIDQRAEDVVNAYKNNVKNYINALITISINSANAAVTTKNIKIGTKIIAIR